MLRSFTPKPSRQSTRVEREQLKALHPEIFADGVREARKRFLEQALAAICAVATMDAEQWSPPRQSTARRKPTRALAKASALRCGDRAISTTLRAKMEPNAQCVWGRACPILWHHSSPRRNRAGRSEGASQGSLHRCGGRRKRTLKPRVRGDGDPRPEMGSSGRFWGWERNTVNRSATKVSMGVSEGADVLTPEAQHVASEITSMSC